MALGQPEENRQPEQQEKQRRACPMDEAMIAAIIAEIDVIMPEDSQEKVPPNEPS